jgi:hypothetical protein
MKVWDIGAAIDKNKKVVFAAKVNGEIKFVKVKSVLTKHSVAVVLECEYGDNANYDVLEKEEISVLHRNVLRVAFDTTYAFRQDAMAKGAAAAFDKMNY